MIETDLFINGGSYWGFGILGFLILTIAGAITWGTSESRHVGRAVGIPMLVLGILGGAFSIGAAVVTHDNAYAATVAKIKAEGFTDPIDINGYTFTSGEQWCALKPIDDDETIFKIVCEEEK